MPPTNAARLREMAENAQKAANSYAAALLAGAEALEAIERAEKCLDGISVPAVQCFDRAAEIADMAEWVMDAIKKEKEKSDG